MAVQVPLNFSDWQHRVQKARVSRLNDFNNFITTLEKEDIFDARAFRGIRAWTGSQADWGNVVGVAQGTIGNWERGLTYPNRYYRKGIISASKRIFERENSTVQEFAKQLGVNIEIDPISTQKSLEESILRAALTDLDYDPNEQKIVAIPFAKDARFKDNPDFESDRNNLISSLSQQCDLIIGSLSKGTNAETDGLVQYLEKYRDQCNSVPTNPRLLHRLGDILAKRIASEDLRYAVSGWDDAALDGFTSDHLELMRMYYREALAKAQEVEAAVLDDEADSIEAHVFYDVANMIENAETAQGISIFDDDIPTLLRDIGKEVRDLKESIDFTFDSARKDALIRRRREAIKNGSIFIGRVLFFSSLFIVMVAPPSLGDVGSVASIFGLVEAAIPGSILSIYEKFRSVLPLLPSLGRPNASRRS